MHKDLSTKHFYGVGINDADYVVRPKINGKVLSCPFYVVWTNMLKRCYCAKYHKTHPTYAECTVAKEWFLFSNFKAWMTTQDWVGNSIDKDILIQHNKVYSSSSCIFVSKAINNLLTSGLARRGKYPQGVSYNKITGVYDVRCNSNGKNAYLGSYDSATEAHEVYKKIKYKHIAEVASQQSEPLRTALLNYVIEGRTNEVD